MAQYQNIQTGGLFKACGKINEWLICMENLSNIKTCIHVFHTKSRVEKGSSRGQGESRKAYLSLIVYVVPFWFAKHEVLQQKQYGLWFFKKKDNNNYCFESYKTFWQATAVHIQQVCVNLFRSQISVTFDNSQEKCICIVRAFVIWLYFWPK